MIGGALAAAAIAQVYKQQPPPNALVYTTNFQTGIQSVLARGCDTVFITDSEGSGKGSDWRKSLVNVLRDMYLGRYENAGYESGFGRYSVGDPWAANSNTPPYFHKGGFTDGTVSQNYVNPVTVTNASGTSKQCRFSFPAIMQPCGTGGKQYPNKRVELIISTYSTGSTAPTLVVDSYATAAPLSSGDAYIASGTASSITYNGLTGVSQTFTPGNLTGQTEHGLGLLTITFDGSTHCPVIQITTSDNVDILGVRLFNNDWDADGKGNRFHDFAINGQQLLPTRSTQTSGSPNLWAFNSAGFNGRFRQYIDQFGTYGTSNTSVTIGPCKTGRVFFLGLGINDQLLNANTAGTFGSYYMDTVDAVMNASSNTYMVLIIPFCPGSICAAWRKGYDSGGSGNKLHVMTSWSAYMQVCYAAQAKYPDRIAVASLDALLGTLDYADAVVAKGYAPDNNDNIHWGGNGPSWFATQIMNILPPRGTFNLATGLGSGVWNTATWAVRFDRFFTLKNLGSVGGTFTTQSGSFTDKRPQRSADSLSVKFVQNSNLDGYGYAYSTTVAPPQTDYTICGRMYINNSPPAGQAYIMSIFGDEGGTGINYLVRLGNGGASGNALRLNLSTASTNSSSDVPVGSWFTFIITVQRNGTVTYYVNNVAAGTATDSAPANTASSVKFGTTAGPGRPLYGQMGQFIIVPSILGASDRAAFHANPDVAFSFS